MEIPSLSASRAPSSPELEGAPERSLVGLRVVIVDDDGDARDLLATILALYDAEVYAADCAEAGLALVMEERPDVVISDIAMPEEDGYALIGRVRALSAERGGRTPALALTAYAGRADQKRALDAGFDAHLAKPVDVEALVDALLHLRVAARAPAST